MAEFEWHKRPMPFPEDYEVRPAVWQIALDHCDMWYGRTDDPELPVLTVAGRVFQLPSKQALALIALANNPNTPVSNDELKRAVWGQPYGHNNNGHRPMVSRAVFRSTMRSLRNKVNRSPLAQIVGYNDGTNSGYSFAIADYDRFYRQSSRLYPWYEDDRSCRGNDTGFSIDE